MKGFAVYDTAIGFIRIDYEKSYVTAIKRLDEKPVDMGMYTSLSDKVYTEITEYLEGKRKSFDFHYDMQGTAFQKKVWRELLNIPYGETRTYKDIAIAIGDENAARAVGMANNRNMLPFVIPCHRVIGAKGKLVGYAYGLELKQYLLNLEQNNI